MIKVDGCLALSRLLCGNTTLKELVLAGNRINNDGVQYLAQFLDRNTTLMTLDISRNHFNDNGFEIFASQIGKNNGIIKLDISKNKDLSDEVSLVTLAEAIARNRCLETIILEGIRLRKPFLK
jgi:hypothetical protein